MTRLLIRGATVLADDGWVDDAVVLASDGRIEAIEQGRALADGAVRDEPATVVDAPGLLLTPGFIELQTNGGFGVDVSEEPAGIWRLGARLAESGVTAFLPTVVTRPAANFAAAQAVCAAGPPADHRGAVPLGLHFEGPFLNPEKRGAHEPAWLRSPDPEFAATWSRDNAVRLVTLAPELPGALDLARTLVDRGVVVSAGHSMATLEQARAGFDAGIRYGTHLFNAMPRLDHRAPGLAGALLHDERATFGVIADGLHVDPALVAVAWRIGGRARMSIVTDQMVAVGMGEGEYSHGQHSVFVRDGAARLADGTLAGSLLTLDQAVRNLVAFGDCLPADAIRTVTDVPARLLGIERERGRLAPGLAADFVLLTPSLEVALTVVDGEIVHRAPTANGAAGPIGGSGAKGASGSNSTTGAGAPPWRITIEEAATAGDMVEGY